MPSPLGHALGGVICALALGGDAASGSAWSRRAARSRRRRGRGRGSPACCPTSTSSGAATTWRRTAWAPPLPAGLVVLAGVARSRAGDSRRSSPRPGRRTCCFDWLGSDDTPPLGVMALWPMTSAFYFAHAFVFEAISRRYWLAGFWAHNLWAVAERSGDAGADAAARRWRRVARDGRGRRRPERRSARAAASGAAGGGVGEVQADRARVGQFLAFVLPGALVPECAPRARRRPAPRAAPSARTAAARPGIHVPSGCVVPSAVLSEQVGAADDGRQAGQDVDRVARSCRPPPTRSSTTSWVASLDGAGQRERAPACAAPRRAAPAAQSFSSVTGGGALSTSPRGVPPLAHTSIMSNSRAVSFNRARAGRLFAEQLDAQRLGPRRGVVVGEQRHRRDAALDVAAAAVLAEQREHVVVEGVLRGDGLVRLAGRRRAAAR